MFTFLAGDAYYSRCHEAVVRTLPTNINSVIYEEIGNESTIIFDRVGEIAVENEQINETTRGNKWTRQEEPLVSITLLIMMNTLLVLLVLKILHFLQV